MQQLICLVVAWTFLVGLIYNLVTALRDINVRTKTMHQIPCPDCRYFTNDYRLKCTVNPSIANTEEAIQCSAYHSTNSIYN